jgi:hemerythrin superfamily protein
MAADAVTLIMNDHRVMERLFEMLKDPNSDRPALIAEVVARLSAHSWAEEEKVYPALLKADPAEESQVYHGVEEHHEATELLHRLMATDPKSSQFDSLLTEFIDAVKHHVEEEESEILPELSESIGAAKLEELGRAFEERRLEVLAAHGFGHSGSAASHASRPATPADQAVGAGGAAAQLALGERAGRGDVAAMTRDELYEKAREADVPGRSQMNKDELAKAVEERN